MYDYIRTAISYYLPGLAVWPVLHISKLLPHIDRGKRVCVCVCLWSFLAGEHHL